MIYKGTTQATNIYLNGQQITKGYKGQVLFFGDSQGETIELTITGDGLITDRLIIGNTYTVVFNLTDNTANKVFGGGQYVFAGDDTDYHNSDGQLAGQNNYFVSENYNSGDNPVTYSGTFTFTANTTSLYLFWTQYTDQPHYFSSGTVYLTGIVAPVALKDYLSFYGFADITFTNGQSNEFDYSYDQETWTHVTGNFTIPLSRDNPTVYLRGNNTKFATSNTVSSHFNITAGTYCSGNIMSLLYGDDFEDKLTLTTNYVFVGLFNGCTGLRSLPKLPATTLSEYCYRQMFGGCTRLEDISDLELPATTLTRGCYSLMFQDCSGITDASFTLPAKLGDSNIYSAMFRRCTSLTEPPVIAMIDLKAGKQYQMNSMFEGCTSLTHSPVLRSQVLRNYCYDSMFKNCSSLMTITALFKTSPSTSYTKDWVNGVPMQTGNPGTYYKNPSATYTTRGFYAIPTYWHVEDYTE